MGFRSNGRFTPDSCTLEKQIPYRRYGSSGGMSHLGHRPLPGGGTICSLIHVAVSDSSTQTGCSTSSNITKPKHSIFRATGPICEAAATKL
ncbi:hypothetical protein BaRGS_00031600 [Batillaria attramentaria]|uniref:Uncharacterized protein n=1 Tax=Batillaria attramentaria TaxID=370345 RepID=A0ABD0JR40_9CAEN